MSIFSKIFNRSGVTNKAVVILSEQEGKERIVTWKNILAKQVQAIDKIEKGLNLGKSWVVDLPIRIKDARNEAEKIKKEMSTVMNEDRLLGLGKKYISKDRLIKQLILTEKAMIGNLRIAEIQYHRLQDRAIELATKVQESEVYLSMAGSLQLAGEFISQIEQPIHTEAMESIASFKSVNMTDQEEITNDEVKSLFKKEFNRVARGNDTPAVRKNRTTKKS